MTQTKKRERVQRWWQQHNLDVALAVSVGSLAGFLTMCVQQGWL